MQSDNPYFHLKPIKDPAHFYDREDEISQVLESIDHEQCVSLVGPRKIGKTSLLFHLETLNRGKPSLIVQTIAEVSEQTAPPQVDLSKLRQTLTNRFSESELQTLCFDLQIDYENLPGKSKADRARELIAFLERRDRISEFLIFVRERRSDVPWDSTLRAVKEAPAAISRAPVKGLQPSSEAIDFVYIYVDGQAHQDTEPATFHSVILHKMCDTLITRGSLIQPVEEPREKMSLFDLRRAVQSFGRRGIRPVILIDEFDALGKNQYFDLGFFNGLRSLATLGIVYVTASKRTLYQLNLDEKTIGSPFFNYFHTLFLGLFDEQSALKLIREPSTKFGVHFDERTVTEIVSLAGGHPFFLQQVCQIAFDLYRERDGELREDDFGVLRTKSQQALEDHLASYWEDLGEEEQHVLQLVVERRDVQQESEKALGDLARKCLLTASTSSYQVFSTLFKDYVHAQPRSRFPREQKWLDRYRDWEELGRGAMSIVYKVYQPALDRHVAIKELRPRAGLLDQHAERFSLEAHRIARLDHPNILPVYDFYQEGDHAYIVMKNASGGALANRLDKTQKPFDRIKAIEIVIHIGRALGYAHRQGVIHRDIKPANIFLGEDDWPFLGDFGLSLSKGDVATEEAGMTGSFDYVAPEQAEEAEKADERSDIYSLGVVLYHLLVGEVPYGEDASAGVRLMKRLTQGVPAPCLRNPQVSIEMEHIILKAAASRPEDRYQTAEAMVEDLERIILKAMASSPSDHDQPCEGMVEELIDTFAITPRTITWLHFSDLHFRDMDAYDESVVLKALLLDITERVLQEDMQPDFITISGDIAFAGRSQEYAMARQFLDDLLGAAGLLKDRLFLVPGNHDVDRGLVTAGMKAIGKNLTDRATANTVLATPGDRRHLMKRFRRYASFVNDYFADHLKFDHEHYYYVRILDLADHRIALLGLNSAWLCASDEDEADGLLIGERQARTALDQAKDADIKIALMHHPFELLRDFDRNDSAAMLQDACDFILHGHLHRPEIAQMVCPDGRAVVIAGGACYETRKYPNSYNFVRLDLSARTGTVYLRRYADARGGFWAKDPLIYKNAPDGIYTFDLATDFGASPVRR